MSKNSYYITTTLPYVNAEPHIGFALEIIRADVLARWQRLSGKDVFFNTGVDEHGLKIFRKAEELGLSAQDYCDQMAGKFELLKAGLNLSYDNFIRTTDQKHQESAQEFWRRCLAQGDIYKKNYQVKYCVGCELEKTDSELVDDHCPVHPGQELELIDEENYFFRFSKYQSALLKLYSKQADFVVPITKQHEITSFVERGLEDFSVSRLKSKMPWGVAVPDDETQVMYVWFDALVNYISCLGWSTSTVNDDMFLKYWPGVQICGKDNLRQQSAMWQAMLMSAELPNSAQILVNGFMTANGQKISKSSGNVINPLDLVEQYGTDALRFYLLAEVNPYDDSDYSQEKFEASYNAKLANGLGNLVARVSTLIEKNNLELTLVPEAGALGQKLDVKLLSYLFNEALELLWAELRLADETISNSKPWTMTDRDQLEACLKPLAQTLLSVGFCLRPFLPNTADKIIAIFNTKKIIKGEALFPRLS
jgi:methionyl-tRNA synthetase